METHKPEIVIIAAVAEKNRVIGNGLSLPWHIPEDLKHFKNHTVGRPLLMGRRTFQSLVQDFGGPLPNRRMMILTSERTIENYPDIETFSSVDEAMAAVANEEMVYIGGGGAVYTHFLPIADRLELTLIEGDYEGDVFFPPFEHLIGPTFKIAEERPRDGYRFMTYRRTDTHP